MSEHPGVRPGQVAGAHGGHGTGPAGGYQGGVHDRHRRARRRVVERQQPELAGQADGVVGHEAADHLDAAHPGVGQVAAEHIEMTGAVVVRDEMHPRLDDHAPVTVSAHRVLYGRDDLGVGQAQGAYVRPGQEPQPQSARQPAPPLVTYAPAAVRAAGVMGMWPVAW